MPSEADLHRQEAERIAEMEGLLTEAGLDYGWKLTSIARNDFSDGARGHFFT